MPLLRLPNRAGTWLNPAMYRSRAQFRPPAEAHSLIIQALEGCPWNQCTFCGMYKWTGLRFLDLDEIGHEITLAAKAYPMARRIFLADGDAMAFSFEKLKAMLVALNRSFPRLARVNVYANGHSILEKSGDELRELSGLRLNTLYMGLESGDDSILRRVRKRETSDEMVQAARLAQASGLKMSVMVLTGLGGQADSVLHASATSDALNRMQPRLLSALRVVPVPGTGLYREEQAGSFQQLTEYQAVQELRAMIAGLELDSTLFRANHSSNILPLEGRFPKDKPRLLAELDNLLDSDLLDTSSPGPAPVSL